MFANDVLNIMMDPQTAIGLPFNLSLRHDTFFTFKCFVYCAHAQQSSTLDSLLSYCCSDERFFLHCTHMFFPVVYLAGQSVYHFNVVCYRYLYCYDTCKKPLEYAFSILYESSWCFVCVCVCVSIFVYLCVRTWRWGSMNETSMHMSMFTLSNLFKNHSFTSHSETLSTRAKKNVGWRATKANISS